jgi:hypothetical protein
VRLAAATAMKKLPLALVLVSLVFCVACGSSGIGGLIGTGRYSNASLNGSYVYQITGWDLGTGAAVPYQEAGIFTANGNGTITAATDYFSEQGGGAAAPGSAATGTYTVNSDGTGTLTLNFSGGTSSINLALTLVSTSKLYLIEADAANSTGVAEKQTSTTLPAAATAFVFKQHSATTTQDFDSVGQFTLATDGTVSGSEDINRNGTINNGGGTGSDPLALTGASAFSAPGGAGFPAGSGTATLADASGLTDFIYFIVDANNIRLLASDSGVVGAGRAEAQTGTFSTDPLSGSSFAFGSKADDNTGGAGAVNTVGSFAASSGTITGTLDSVQDTSSFSNASVSGSYSTFSASGRTVLTLVTGISSSVQQAFWMVSPARAFFLTTADASDASKIEDGTADQQQGTLSNSSLKGQYAFTMDGYDLNPNPGSATFVDRVGWIQWDGSGNLTWNEAVNSDGQGITSSGGLTGTYAVGSGGRTTASVNSLSYNNNDIVLYLVSGSNAYILENDPGVQINGVMNLQQ